MNEKVEIGGVVFRWLGNEAMLDCQTAPVSYGREYFEEYVQRSQTQMAARLRSFRRGYVEAFAQVGQVLDYGCGTGELLDDERWSGYDINPYCQGYRRGVLAYEPCLSHYEAVCFFDSLEHLEDPVSVLGSMKSGTLVVVSMPVWEDWENIEALVQWRHWKVREHRLYVSQAGLCEVMATCGLVLLDGNKTEAALGREDIGTFCFRKE